MDEDEAVSPSAETLRAAVAAVLPGASASEDGYLGDCSSDGGNEKNFPIPPDYKYHQAGVGGGCPCRGADESDDAAAAAAGGGVAGSIEPPAGLAFQNIKQSSLSSFVASKSSNFQLGYQVLLNGCASGSGGGSSHHSHHGRSSRSSGAGGLRKMRSSLKSRLSSSAGHVGGGGYGSTWSAIKAGADERKLRLHAGTNNSEKLERLLAGGASGASGGGGVNPNAHDEHGRTALHIAAAKGYADVVSTLLRHGAEPNQKDSLGNTPLHLAACTNHIQVVTLLLRAGTDVETLDNNGRTPMQLAQSKLKLLQTNPGTKEMAKVKTEVAQVVEMMQEYLSKLSPSCLIESPGGGGANPEGEGGEGQTGGGEGGGGGPSYYSQLLDSFSHRLTLHQTHDDINSDLQNLLDSLGNLSLKKTAST